MRTLAIVLSLLSFSQAHAEDLGPLPACETRSYMPEVPEGYACQSSSGMVFTKKALGWQQSDGKMWYQVPKKGGQYQFNHYNIKEFCRQQNRILPTIADLQEARLNGLFHAADIDGSTVWSTEVESREDNSLAQTFQTHFAVVDIQNRAQSDEFLVEAFCIDWTPERLAQYQERVQAQQAGNCSGLENCAQQPNSAKVAKGIKWNLVARQFDLQSEITYQVWEDSATGLWWGDRLGGARSNILYPLMYVADFERLKFYQIFKTPKLIEEIACPSPAGNAANAGLTEKKFGVPTIAEFEQAEAHGIREVVPNYTEYEFWSADYDYESDGGWDIIRTFNGISGRAIFSSLSYHDNSVRCVGR